MKPWIIPDEEGEEVMTVKGLIAHLGALDPDLPVYLIHGGFLCRPLGYSVTSQKDEDAIILGAHGDYDVEVLHEMADLWEIHPITMK